MPTYTTSSAWSYSLSSGYSRVDALLYGVNWSGHTISFSFPTNQTYFISGYAENNAYFKPLISSDQIAVRSALTSWSNVANLVFIETAETSANVGDLRFAYSWTLQSNNSQAWSYVPGSHPASGDVWFNVKGTSYTYLWDQGSYNYVTAIHEIGHALGLKHPFSSSVYISDTLPSIFDSRSFTVMSYSAESGDSNTYFSYEPTTPMVLDIAAIQYLYGVNVNYNATDTVYTFSAGSNYHQTIWDAGGIDTIVYISASGGVIDLTAGLNGGSRLGNTVYLENQYGQYIDTVKNIWIAEGAVIENAHGGDGDDTIVGNDANNYLFGGYGNDVIFGGLGDDTIDCGDGAGDICSYNLSSSNYSISYLGGKYYISALNGSEGTDVLSGVEYFKFSDQTVAASIYNDFSPVIALSSSDNLLAEGERAVITFTLSESAVDFTIDDISYSGGVLSDFSGSGSSYSVVFTPDAESVSGTVSVSSGKFTNAAGYSNADGIEANNNVIINIDRTAPTIVYFNPNDGLANVAVSSNIVLTFSEAIKFGSGNIEIHQDSAEGPLLVSYDVENPGSVLSISGATLTINPVNNLSSSTHYFVSIPAGALKDFAGNNHAGVAIYDFTTAAPIPLVITGTSGSDTLNGADGNDRLTGGGGSDTMNGGAGDDLYIIATTAEHPGTEIINDASGVDELRFTSGTASTLVLSSWVYGVEKIVIGTGTGATAYTSGMVSLNVNAAALSYGVSISGNAGANILTGSHYDDVLTGGKGIDTFNINGGRDTITDLGNGGADIVKVSAGAVVDATLQAVWKASSSSVNNGTVNIFTSGLSVDLSLITALNIGTNGYNVINTGAATNLTGSGKADTLTGGAGNDILIGGSGNDTLNGADGNDRLTGGGGSDILNGGAGDDLYIIATTAEHPGTEIINDASGVDELRFTSGTASTLVLSSWVYGVEKIVIGTGTATTAYTSGTVSLNINAAALGYGVSISGNAGANILTGSHYDDTLIGGSGNDRLVGGGGNDVLNGGAGADNMSGGSGNDIYAVDNIADKVIELAGEGADIIETSVSYSLTALEHVENITLTGTAAINATGNAMNNMITGNSAANILNGGAGNDRINGGAGNDTLNGGEGDDVLSGGLGNDILYGGTGADAFVFEFALNATNNKDIIKDFETGQDVIKLDDLFFSNIDSFEGVLDSSNFVVGTQATSQSHHIIYNDSTGALFYDADGSGAGAAIQFATISAAAKLESNHFLII